MVCSETCELRTFTGGAICVKMIAGIADTSETARWLHTIARAVKIACFSFAAGSTLVDICTYSVVKDVTLCCTEGKKLAAD